MADKVDIRAENKSKRLGLRLSAADQIELTRRAGCAGMSISEYVRSVALCDLSPDALEAIAAIRNLYVELKREGVNLNQAVKALNILIKQGGAVGDAAQESVVAITDSVKLIRDLHARIAVLIEKIGA